ncbi:xanthine dehydrogenase family protein [Tessaracoccus sp. SD287]|uniref:aerobic carbon-monoxide dehydrogenase large subunit n=1 Tax=Tessaracoccus sp. SD287 TaxID=2782008 RepID=UPI001A95AD3F|nr:aerobic carbon-monoxide dehydrogenase large subunit [Tessaracoccus sp. SD287]MBO1031454.1 xanthine dehydrogenase family protein [Tessaracoccus sp. SD287]
MSGKMMGAAVQRREDPRLVSGDGKYTDDLSHTALEAAFVRSPHAHARILDIDVDAAVEVDGVIAVWTWEDLEGAAGEPLPMLLPHPSIQHPVTAHALAKDQVNHVGEAIVMVVATNRYIAEDAAQKVSVSYDVQPPVVGIANAREAELLVHEEAPGNVGAHYVQNVGDAPAAIEDAPHMLELDFDFERSACMPMEGKAVQATWHAASGELSVASSTQTSTGLRAALAAKLEMPLAKLHVVVPDVGGGFGVKINHPWPEEVCVAAAAKRLQAQVKWTEDRREHFISSAHERGQLQRARVGFDDDGVIRGLDVTFWHDHGAYMPYGVIVPLNTSVQLVGPYRLPNYRVEYYSLYTNTVIVTPYRGAGRPQGVFIMERTMDAIADYLGLDRAEVRSRNFIQPEQMPWEVGLMFQDGRPTVYDSGDFPASLRKLKELVGWDDFEAYRQQAAAEGRKVGLGIGCYVEGTGIGPYEGGHIQVETNGRVNVATGVTTQGQGHATSFAQIVADELGVPLEDVFITTGDTRRFGYSVGTFASRAAVTSGSAVHLAATQVKQKALKIAGNALEADPEDLEIVDGFIRIKGDPENKMSLGMVSVLSNPLRYAFDETAKAATQFSTSVDLSKPPIQPGEEPGLEGKDFYSPKGATFANGMHAAIVETDPETADITVLRYCVIHDCGKMINPMIVEGQVHGGVAQGIGGALYEKMAYDDSGQLLNASFMDFLMPFATEVPHIETDHLETPTTLNPLGIKGAGEAGTIPASAVIASAIEDAEGFPITKMPISPADLWELRRKHEAGQWPSLRHPHPQP